MHQRGLCLLGVTGAALFAVITAPSTAEARIDIHAQGQLGIESGAFAALSQDDQKFTGYSAGALARLPFAPYELGLGLSYINWSWTDNDTDWSLSQFLINLEAGFHISPFANFTLAALMGYDFGFAGSIETENGNTTVSRDTNGFGRRTHTLRGLYQITPEISLGADLKFMTGSVDYELGNTVAEPEFDLWGFKVLIDYAF